MGIATHGKRVVRPGTPPVPPTLPDPLALWRIWHGSRLADNSSIFQSVERRSVRMSGSGRPGIGRKGESTDPHSKRIQPPLRDESSRFGRRGILLNPRLIRSGRIDRQKSQQPPQDAPLTIRLVRGACRARRAAASFREPPPFPAAAGRTVAPLCGCVRRFCVEWVTMRGTSSRPKPGG